MKIAVRMLLAAAAVSVTSSAANAQSFTATPGVFDPQNTGIVRAELLTQIVPKTVDRHRRSVYLFLQKNGASAVNAAAGADFGGVAGIRLTSLSYEYTANSACGGGSPRFDVSTNSGAQFHFIGGCANGTKSVNPVNGNLVVSFDPTNPAQAFPVVAPTERVTAMDILVDEGTDVGSGFAYIQNIKINGQTVQLIPASRPFIPNHRHNR